MLRLFSADDHIIGHARVWQDRVPAKYRDVAPHIVEEGRLRILEYETEVLDGGLTQLPASRLKNRVWIGFVYTDMRIGCYDPRRASQGFSWQTGFLPQSYFQTLPRLLARYSHFQR